MRVLAALAAGVFFTVLIGCSSLPSADVDWDTEYDFSRVKTFHFIDREKLRTMTPLTDDITRNRIENAIDKTLRAKGFIYEADPKKADTLVSYHVTTEDKQDIQTYNVGVSHCWTCPWGRGMGVGYGTTQMRVRDYTEGTMIMDMIDPATNESVWRGMLSARITQFKTQQERIDSINYAVQTILAGYPPAPAAP